tara:strand:- start:476 stop:583 length:108 start_codon:yes stop_codon:yes gene_type:complete
VYELVNTDAKDPVSKEITVSAAAPFDPENRFLKFK